MKNGKLKNVPVLIIYFMILGFASCENPVVSDPVVPEVEIQEEEQEIIPDPVEETIIEVEPEVIIEDPIIVVPGIESTLYSLQGVQRVETSEPYEINRYVISEVEYIDMMVEVDGKDYFLFMGDNILNNFGIDATCMTLEEFNIIIEIVGLFPGVSLKELKEVYNP